MGTVVSFDVRCGSASEGDLVLALAEARARLHRADAVFSTWKAESPMSRLRRGEITVAEAPPEMLEVLQRCEEARQASGGWFDPWAMPGGVDPTGLVKGWAAARALEAVTRAGPAGAMVSAAGDIGVWGDPEPGRSWRIGIQDPWNRHAILGVVEVRRAIATSGTYERGSHIIDPTTGQPSRGVVSATVIGPELDLADAFATGLMAGGEAALAHIVELEGYEALLIADNGGSVATPGFTFSN
jgi:thiamine biosynthesis lipoprotein